MHTTYHNTARTLVLWIRGSNNNNNNIQYILLSIYTYIILLEYTNTLRLVVYILYSRRVLLLLRATRVVLIVCILCILARVARSIMHTLLGYTTY